MGKKGIITGALILTIAGVITRVLGFVYRIYMSNAIGAEGMGLYQLIVPIYSLVWSIACSGFTTTISKLTAQEKARGEYGNLSRILKQSIIMSTAIGVLLSFLLYIFSADIAQIFFKEPRITMSLKIIALCVPFMAAGSCMRGYFFGLQETLIPAINQVFEQVIRMTVVFLIAGIFIPMGLEYACAAACIGIVVEEIFSFLFVLVAHNMGGAKKLQKTLPTLSRLSSLSLIVTMALPLTLNRVAGSLLSTLENAMIPQRLQVYGLTQGEAMSIYGQISGMAMPLIFFPSAFLLSLSISLVPAVSEAKAIGNNERIRYTTSKSMLFASIIGFLASGIFIVYSRELGQIIYKQDLSRMLVLFGIMCPFLYMQVVLSGILNGLGFQVFIFRNSLISSVINLGFIYFLTPIKGVDAFIFGWFISLIVVCFLEIEKLRESVDVSFDFSDWFFKPVICSAASGLLVNLLFKESLFRAFGNVLGLVMSLSILSLLYMVFIILTGSLSIGDLQQLFNFKPKKSRA